MESKKTGGFFSQMKYDLPASLVVFLVALPLCLGIALASGAPLFGGLIAGIVGGTIVALLSGSSLGVSGPAAGLAVIVLTAIEDLGAYDIFLLAVVFGGLFQLILGFLRAGVIGYYFPNSVIKGMLAAIGIIIVLKQIPHAVGYDANPEGNLSFWQMDGENTLSELVNMINYISPGAVLISIISLAILILFEQKFIKKIDALRFVPGPLVAVLVGIGLGLGMDGNEVLALRDNQMVKIPVAESISGFFQQFTFPDFSHLGNPAIYITGITLAVVASLETLLCVEATDKLDPQKRVTPTNRELRAQGIGNMVSGLVGGLPITQVIVRSSANIQSGGRTKASAFIHGLLLLITAMIIPSVLNKIPLASLAAVLFVVGYKLAKPSLFKEMLGKGSAQFIPFIITIIGIVFTDLLIGIMIGFSVAIVDILYRNFKTPYHFNAEDYKEGDPIYIELGEEVSFLNKASIQNTLNQIPDGSTVTLDGSKIRFVHPDVLDIIDDFVQNAETRDITVNLKNLGNKPSPNPVGDFGEKVLNQPIQKSKWKK